MEGNKAPFRFGKNLASSRTRTRDTVIRKTSTRPHGRVDIIVHVDSIGTVMKWVDGSAGLYISNIL